LPEVVSVTAISSPTRRTGPSNSAFAVRFPVWPAAADIAVVFSVRPAAPAPSVLKNVRRFEPIDASSPP
jgi:hypothetical protein